MIAHKSVAAASGEDWNQMFRDGGREGVRQEQQLWSGGWVGLGGGGQWGGSWHSGENTWLPSPPNSPRQASLCLQTGAAKLLTDSRIRLVRSLVRRDNQVQGGTWEVPRKATSWPEICPCCPTGTALLRAKHACSPSGRERTALSSECLTGNWCTQKFVFRTAIESCPGWGALWQRKPDH